MLSAKVRGRLHGQMGLARVISVRGTDGGIVKWAACILLVVNRVGMELGLSLCTGGVKDAACLCMGVMGVFVRGHGFFVRGELLNRCESRVVVGQRETGTGTYKHIQTRGGEPFAMPRCMSYAKPLLSKTITHRTRSHTHTHTHQAH